MSPNQQLTKDWIQYLKNNRIVGMQSDDKSGSLNYKRKVTTDDIRNFLQNYDEYEPDAIDAAIGSVTAAGTDAETNGPTAGVPAVSGQQPSGVSDWHQSGMSPGAPATPRQPLPAPASAPRTKKYSNTDATDVDYRDVQAQRQLGTTPQSDEQNPPEDLPAGTPPRKPRVKHVPTAPGTKPRVKFVKEALRDNPGNELGEKDVQAIFGALTKKQPAAAGPKQEPGFVADPEEQANKEIAKIKKIIRDTMNDQQRMSLWRALRDA